MQRDLRTKKIYMNGKLRDVFSVDALLKWIDLQQKLTNTFQVSICFE